MSTKIAVFLAVTPVKACQSGRFAASFQRKQLNPSLTQTQQVKILSKFYREHMTSSTRQLIFSQRPENLKPLCTSISGCKVTQNVTKIHVFWSVTLCRQASSPDVSDDRAASTFSFNNIQHYCCEILKPRKFHNNNLYCR